MLATISIIVFKWVIFLFTFALLVSILFAFIVKFYNEVYIPSKRNSILSFESSLTVLQVIIETELNAYETDIFSTIGNITNQNFENYYKDITSKIIDNLSPDFIKNITLYISEDALYKIIARSVKKYLTEKISGVI